MRISYAYRTAAWLLAGAIVILSLVPPDLRPETGAPRNLEHLAMYFLTGLAFSLGYVRSPVLLALSFVVFTGLIELMQQWVPGRHARLSDFVVDALAMVGAVVLVALARRIPIGGTP